MKLFFGVVALLLLCSGCASDDGVYHEETGTIKYNTETLDVTPRFRIDKPMPTVADKGLDVLLGKWRVRVNKDYVIGADRNALVNGNGGKASQWEIDEYEFKGDASYSMRRIAKDGKTVLECYGEEGRWAYADGILRLREESAVLPDPFISCLPKRYDTTSVTQWIEYRVKWHSERSFTLEYVDPNKAKIGIAMEGLLGEIRLSGLNGHYDERGCYHCTGLSGIGFVSVVCNPLCFKRVDK